MNELSKYGLVEVFSDKDGIFTLLMTGNNLTNSTSVFKILGIAMSLTDKKSIHVMKNENNFLLLILT